MRSGDLKHLVTIQQLTTGQDDIGQPTQAWVDLAQVWADVRYLSGLETVRAGAESTSTRVSVRIRRRTDVTAAMRLVYEGKTLQITAVLPDEVDRRSLDLVCEVLA